MITQSPLSSHSGELLGDCLVFGGRGYNPNPSGDESSDEDSQTPEEVAQIEAAEKERRATNQLGYLWGTSLRALGRWMNQWFNGFMNQLIT